jgi:hypothetical protein
MQLTANFVVLATALAYSSSRVLALPVDSAYAARDVEYDLDARDVGSSDMIDYKTRDLYDLFLEARGYYDDGLDAREYETIEMQAREYFEDLEARAATVRPFFFNTLSSSRIDLSFSLARFSSDASYTR